MVMKKQFKVTFNVTTTLSDEQEVEFVKSLIGMAKAPNQGKYFDNILVSALTDGPDGALVQVIKQAIHGYIKERFAENCGRGDYCGMKFSPARVEVIR